MTLRQISESCKTPKQNTLETHRIMLTLIDNDAQQ